MHVFDIEKRVMPQMYQDVISYRFISLYNGMLGTWFDNKESAIKQGEAHQEIVNYLID